MQCVQRVEKYLVCIDGKEFYPGNIVHVRARVVHLRDESAIDGDGRLDDEEAIKLSDWCKQKRITIRNDKLVATESNPQLQDV